VSFQTAENARCADTVGMSTIYKICRRKALRRSDWKVTTEVVCTARADYGIPRSTIFRIASRFLATRRTSNLLAQKRSPGILNELAINAIRAGTERITDEEIESWKPILEMETLFS
jgi:hypothetical protein